MIGHASQFGFLPVASTMVVAVCMADRCWDGAMLASGYPIVAVGGKPSSK